MGIIPTSILVLFLIGHVSSDIAEDKKECQNQLLAMSPCLTYVSGEVKTPSTPCCTALRKDYNSTERCLCLLVKDRNDPDLGFKINATLALNLPYICQAHPNISHCVALLHLAPGSPDAQVFEDFARGLAADSNHTATTGGTPTSSSASVKERWGGLRRTVGNVSLWLLVILCFDHMIINHV